MNYVSVREAAVKFNLSERRIQKLCEEKRIEGCVMMSGVWLIPEEAKKPTDSRLTILPPDEDIISLSDLCKLLSISLATGRNWIKLGKISPEYSESGVPFFRREYATSLITSIQANDIKSLKSRRNKKFVSGNTIYQDYISEDSKNFITVSSLIENIESSDIDLSDDVIQYLVCDCALKLQLIKSGSQTSDTTFIDFLTGILNLPTEFIELLDDLIYDKDKAKKFATRHPNILGVHYVYEENEDILGLIYISCKKLNDRKATGSYYTPTRIVKQLVNELKFDDSSKILDPCCGTGNFLLQLPNQIQFDAIYGNDIDLIGIKITRLNMKLKFFSTPNSTIKEHITQRNFLFDFSNHLFSHIIGNPPWGYDFTTEEVSSLKTMFQATKMASIESYDIFIEKALNCLKPNGEISFVLPEAIMNVKSHEEIRRIILDQTLIKEVTFLGNAFSGVQCPCVILRFQQTADKFSTIGLVVNKSNTSFTIKKEREISSDYFSFNTTDDEYDILQKIKTKSKCVHLKNNADFALGIVTGNNKEYISNRPKPENEPILRGSDICKYRKKSCENYISFVPDKFQQVAPIQFYRAKEKLLYRFISNQLIFAFDDAQTLSLNSCNIVIPKFKDLNTKFVMAILNSRVAQFLFEKDFASVKVLRSHIESIPIPLVTTEQQTEIVQLVDLFITGVSKENLLPLYNDLDTKICNLFNLSDKEQKIIKDTVDQNNKFLE